MAEPNPFAGLLESSEPVNPFTGLMDTFDDRSFEEIAEELNLPSTPARQIADIMQSSDDEEGIFDTGGKFLSVAGKSIKDLVIGGPSFIAGSLVRSAEFQREFAEQNPLAVFSPAFLGAVGTQKALGSLINREVKPSSSRVSSFLLDVADASYEDLLDSQAEFINSFESSAGRGVASVVGTGVFGVTNLVSPAKWLRLTGTILGLAPKAAILMYGGYKLGGKGIKHIRHMMNNASLIGDLPDAARPYQEVLSIVESTQDVTSEIPLDELVTRARKLAQQSLAFPQAPVRRFAKDIPDELIDAAEQEIRLQKDLNLPSSFRLVEKEAAKLVSKYDIVTDAPKEIAKRIADTNPRKTPLPILDPELSFTDLRTAGRILASKFVANRDTAEFEAAARASKLVKEFDDLSLREDLTAALQGTGSGKVGFPDSIENVLNRIRAHPQGEQALSLLDDWKRITDSLFDEITELNSQLGDDSVSYLDGYIRQLWQVDKNYSKFISRVANRGGFENAREIPSYFLGITKLGLTPRSLDIAELMYHTERQYGLVLATKKLFRDIGTLNILEDGLPALTRIPKAQLASPEKYVPIRSRFFSRLVPGEGDLFIHQDLHQPLKSILAVQSPQGQVERAIDTLSSFAKMSNFSFSLFHAYSLSESALSAIGPLRGTALITSLVTKGGGVPFVDDILTKLGAPSVSQLLKTTGMKEAELRALKYNVKLGAPTADLLLSKWDKALRTGAEKLGPVAGKPAELYRWAQRQVNTSLWDRYHHPMKVMVFDQLYNNFLQIKRGNQSAGFVPNLLGAGKKITDLSDDEIGRRIGSFVNDEFGGQNWELLSGSVMEAISHPNRLKWLRRIFTSPDWNVSSIRASLAFAQLFPGTRFSDPVRGVLGLRHWRNAFMGAFFYANVANKLLSGKFVHENEPGKDRFHIDTGLKNENGRKVYIRWGKQFQELPDLVKGSTGGPIPFFGFLLRKTLPYLQATTDPFSSPGGFETVVSNLAEKAAREGRELDGIDYSLAFSKQVGRSVLPFSFQEAGRVGPLLAAVPLPKSLGLSTFSAETLLTEAYRDTDTEKVIRILQALRDNGFTDKEINSVNSRARKKSVRFPEQNLLERIGFAVSE